MHTTVRPHIRPSTFLKRARDDELHQKQHSRQRLAQINTVLASSPNDAIRGAGTLPPPSFAAQQETLVMGKDSPPPTHGAEDTPGADLPRTPSPAPVPASPPRTPPSQIRRSEFPPHIPRTPRSARMHRDALPSSDERNALSDSARFERRRMPLPDAFTRDRSTSPSPAPSPTMARASVAQSTSVPPPGAQPPRSRAPLPNPSMTPGPPPTPRTQTPSVPPGAQPPRSRLPPTNPNWTPSTTRAPPPTPRPQPRGHVSNALTPRAPPAPGSQQRHRMPAEISRRGNGPASTPLSPGVRAIALRPLDGALRPTRLIPLYPPDVRRPPQQGYSGNPGRPVELQPRGRHPPRSASGRARPAASTAPAADVAPIAPPAPPVIIANPAATAIPPGAAVPAVRPPRPPPTPIRPPAQAPDRRPSTPVVVPTNFERVRPYHNPNWRPGDWINPGLGRWARGSTPRRLFVEELGGSSGGTPTPRSTAALGPAFGTPTPTGTAAISDDTDSSSSGSSFDGSPTPSPFVIPNRDKPSADEPGADEHGPDTPSANEPASAEHTSDEPSPDKPSSDEPTANKPIADEHTFNKPTDGAAPDETVRPDEGPLGDLSSLADSLSDTSDEPDEEAAGEGHSDNTATETAAVTERQASEATQTSVGVPAATAAADTSLLSEDSSTSVDAVDADL